MAAAALASIHVLHVDDEPDFSGLTATFIERQDDRFTVDTASNASEGLDRLSQGDFDCVVSDFDMPGQNGIEFLEAVRQDYPELPFILFTGKGSEEIASTAISAGVTDYLQKQSGTSQYEVLANRIRNAVQASQFERTADQRQHRLEQILKAVPACVVRIDYDGQFVFANDRAEEILGLKPADVAERTYNDPEWQITDLEGEPIPDEELPFRQVRDSGEPIYGYRHMVEWPDGTRKALQVDGTPLFDDAGNLQSTVFALTDITDQVKRERELRESSRRLELALEATETGVWEWDMETDEVVWSETLEELLGIEPGTFEGTFEAHEEYLHPDDVAVVTQAVEQAIEEGTFTAEFRMIQEDGEHIWVRGLAEYLSEDGSERMVGTTTEITERKERERELERYEAYLEESGDIITVFDENGTVKYESPAVRRILGYEQGELVGETGFDYIHPDDQEAVFEVFSELLSDPDQAVTAEYRFQTADGEWCWLEARGTNQLDTDPINGVITSNRDITERKKRERELERKNDRLEQFTSIVSHDLRNPLSVANGRLELAREECENDHLDAIESAHERMEALIADLLVFAREGETEADITTVELADLAENCWRNVDTADATFVSDIDRTVRADESRLSQLFENLIRNAVEHGSADVTVTLGALADGFYVEDDGPGIPPEARDDIFEAGYSTSEDGTGFGLSIVNQIVDAHDWNLRVKDGADGGARFEITGIEFATDGNSESAATEKSS